MHSLRLISIHYFSVGRKELFVLSQVQPLALKEEEEEVRGGRGGISECGIGEEEEREGGGRGGIREGRRRGGIGNV